MTGPDGPRPTAVIADECSPFTAETFNVIAERLRELGDQCFREMQRGLEEFAAAMDGVLPHPPTNRAQRRAAARQERKRR